MMKANEAVVGRVFTRELNTARGTEYDHEFLLTEEWVGNIFGDNLSIALNDLYPIPLTPEWLERFGFYQLPHFTIQNNWIKELGRGRFLSVACVGTPNEMVFITEEESPVVKSIIVARNYDYDGKTYVHQLQNLYFAMTGEELKLKQK